MHAWRPQPDLQAPALMVESADDIKENGITVIQSHMQDEKPNEELCWHVTEELFAAMLT